MPSPFLDREVIIRFLKRHGFKCLGSGAFSEVFGRSDFPFAIKVNMEPDDWPDFALWTLRNPSPHYVDVKKIKWFVDEHGPYYIAVMERLEQTMREYLRKNDFIDCVEAQNMSKLRTMMSRDVSNRHAAELVERETEHRALFDAALALKREFHARSFLDLHEWNVMLRADGTMVITDPISTVETGDGTAAADTAQDIFDFIAIKQPPAEYPASLFAG